MSPLFTIPDQDAKLMQTKWTWFDRTFAFDFPAEKLPDILERLRGTPVRLEESTSLYTDAILVAREGNTWSIKENVGHLTDVEPLWTGRIDDIINQRETMREADLTNKATFQADHNSRNLDQLCADFRRVRSELTEQILALDPRQWSLTANHPRLGLPMRVVDLCHFVCEHDDYHLARIRYLGSQMT